MPTQLGLVLIPLCVLYAFRPDRLLQMIFIFSVFEAAAAITVGDIGLQPGLAPAMTFVAFVTLQLLLGARYPGARHVTATLLPFCLMTAYAVVGSYLMPTMFDGAVLVWPQKLAPGVNDVQPLHFSFFNLTQDLYLVANGVILILAALYSTSANFRFWPLRTGYFVAAYVVVALSFWQLASRLSGVYYPTEFLHSNPGWMLNGGQELANVPRIDASFSEPSSLAIYMCGVIYGCAWAFVRGDTSKANRALLVLAFMTLVISTSTTGFATVGVGAVVLLAWSFASGSPAALTRTVKLVLPLIAGVAIVAFVASVLFPAAIDAAAKVVSATMDKGDSASYNDRTGTDLTSLGLVGDTFGLGVGWGSNRSSSLVPGLLASIGIPGSLLLVWFIASIVRLVRASRPMATPAQAVTIDLFAASVLGQLVAACISSPTISSPEFFAKLGVVIGCASRVRIGGRAVLRRPAWARRPTLSVVRK